jgi:hypothetical protein
MEDIIMGYRFKYKPSKAKAREFAQTMDAIDSFCASHGINHSLTSDSYYFYFNGKSYRVSNHTIEASDKGCFDAMGNKIRDSYHAADSDLICYTAGKTRLIQVYSDIVAGYKLDKRGRRIV